MGKYFENIKDNLKIMQEFESSETEEESSSAMKALRPNLIVSKVSHKFKDVLAQESARRKKLMYSNKNYS